LNGAAGESGRGLHQVLGDVFPEPQLVEVDVGQGVDGKQADHGEWVYTLIVAQACNVRTHGSDSACGHGLNPSLVCIFAVFPICDRLKHKQPCDAFKMKLRAATMPASGAPRVHDVTGCEAIKLGLLALPAGKGLVNNSEP